MNLSHRQRVVLDALGIDVWVRPEQIPALVAASQAVTAAPEIPFDKPVSRSGAPAEFDASEPEKQLLQVTEPVAETVPAAKSYYRAPVEWDELNASIRECTRCELHKTRTQAVCGSGDVTADWLIIGEAPRTDEDQQGKPFVGTAGDLFNQMLRAIGLQRDAVYITNILKCRPPGDRDPEPTEVEQCMPYLERQIANVAPKLILVVGRIAAQNLLQVSTPVGRLRGEVHYFGAKQIPVVVTYHPAYLLSKPAQKRKTWQDLLLAKRVADEVSS